MKKYEIVYEKIKSDILNGYLTKNSQIPSIRQSCNSFNMSQTTIEKAYDQLVLDGYIKSIPQVGYVVKFSREQIQLHREIEKSQTIKEEDTYTYDFRAHSVSQDSFEMNMWKRYIKDVLDDKQTMSMYGSSQGELQLRQALSRYAYKNRGVLCHPNQILIGSNYQSLLYILCGMLAKNLVIGMEEEASSQAKKVFDSYGFSTIFLSKDTFMDDLKQKKIDVLYINPASLGRLRRPISSSMADELLVYTSSQNILIIEDDYNGELTYRSSSRQALQSMAIDDNVIYLGSFSRLLLPSFRISYMILNEAYVDLYQDDLYGPTASKIEQIAFTHYIRDGYLDKHLRKLKREYKEKSELMESLLKKYTSIPFYLNEAYMTYFNEDIEVNKDTLKELCNQEYVGITLKEKGIELSFANISLEDMEKGIQLFVQNLNKARV